MQRLYLFLGGPYHGEFHSVDDKVRELVVGVPIHNPRFVPSLTEDGLLKPGAIPEDVYLGYRTIQYRREKLGVRDDTENRRKRLSYAEYASRPLGGWIKTVFVYGIEPEDVERRLKDFLFKSFVMTGDYQ